MIVINERIRHLPFKQNKTQPKHIVIEAIRFTLLCICALIIVLKAFVQLLSTNDELLRTVKIGHCIRKNMLLKIQKIGKKSLKAMSATGERCMRGVCGRGYAVNTP